MKYRVLRNCYGFLGRGYKRDDIVEIDPALNPPQHFEPLEVPKEQAPVETKTVEPAMAPPPNKPTAKKGTKKRLK